MSACSCPRHRAERLSDAEATRVLAGNLALGVIRAVKAGQATQNAAYRAAAEQLTPEQRTQLVNGYEGRRPEWDS